MLIYIPLLALPKSGMLAAIRLWTAGIFKFQRTILSLEFEFRGLDNLPEGPCIIASAHQSAWDTIAFYAVVDDPAFVMKQELYRVPLFGPYARKLKMIAIDRSGGVVEARHMIQNVVDRLSHGRKVVIFPGGTRSAPNEIVQLKPGVTTLYRRTNVPVVPVSLNSGYFWGRRSFCKKSGCIVAAFQEPIPPGLNSAAFGTLLSRRIHAGNRELFKEAGLG